MYLLYISSHGCGYLRDSRYCKTQLWDNTLCIYIYLYRLDQSATNLADWLTDGKLYEEITWGEQAGFIVYKHYGLLL